MKKYVDHDENIDAERAEEAIKKSELTKEALSSRKEQLSEDTLLESERVEKLVEAVHQVSRMNKQKGTERLFIELKKKEKRKNNIRRLWYMGSSTAAVLIIAFSLLVWLQSREIDEENKVPVLALSEIKVPTLITLENKKDILSQDTLDWKNAEQGYIAGKESKKYNDEQRDKNDTGKPVLYHRIVIPAGYTYKVQLADGSSVTLNAGSELQFPEVFPDSLREVEFSGEGYFEIEKSDKPFIVKAGGMQVKVYGTKFHMLYSEKLDLTEAVLLEGSIGMNANKKEVKIVPNQRVYCSINDLELNTETVDPANYIGWLGNSFKYNRASLDKIVFDISQWYGIEIRLAPGLEKEKFSLEFDKTSTIDWIMRALGLIVNKPVNKEGGVYLIK